MLSKIFTIRQQKELPLYCRPVALFIAVWLMMLGTFELYISYTSYPHLSLALLLFASSLASFLIGYATVRLAYSAVNYVPSRAKKYRIDLDKLRRFHVGLLIVSSAIIIFNLKSYGLPPVFGFFGADTLNYQEYGSLRQVLFPAIMALFLTAPIEISWIRRWPLYAYGPLCALAYASRGYLLIMLFQILMVFSLRTRMSKRKIYIVALATLCVAISVSSIIGNSRSSMGSQALLAYMQIKKSYYDLDPAFLWMISYISSPISNMCWIVHVYRYDHPTISFLSNLLPGFLSPKTLREADLGSDYIVDGVHSYLANYYMSLWWFGIFGINYVWGIISGYIDSGNRLTRNYLTSAVLLGCIGFMFFSDFLTMLIIILELILLGLAQRYFTVEILSFPH